MENLTQLDNMSSEDQEILATRWLSAGQLEAAGIPCRRGRFVEQETQNIHEAIERYQTEHKLNDEELDDLIHSDFPNGSGFWSYIARAVPGRGVKSIYYHVKRARDDIGKAGKWDVAEDEHLRMAVQTHGTNWVAVRDLVGRSAADCSDRYRQHVQFKDTNRRRGAWSLEEESQLLCAIEEAKVGITNMSARGFWVSVSKILGGTRTPKQCHSKWSDTLQVKNGNEAKARWSTADNYILVCKIASLNVDKETDIDWKSLNDPSWMWTSQSLQRRWRGLKARVDTDGILSHHDIINALVERTRRDLPFAPSSNVPSTTT